MSESKKTVLLVDDDEDCRMQMRAYLAPGGYEIQELCGKQEADEYLAERAPDLAVFDLMMEEPDSGFTLCYETKKRYPNLPIILATGVAGETGMEFSTATSEERSWVKADAVLNKPIRPEQLRAEVARLLEEEI